ncbi:hypothetical protein BpHYR1_008721 [Brachionus plicatilis]|uniref:Uncharacterized protein n=1 Tax=Brachionus plicatilis TaxID=10195 RepID=A0A3M7SR10_BRAPC|nr:hypothetical protein BpHYR1_008721 [Brachionus plicatilis]
MSRLKENSPVIYHKPFDDLTFFLFEEIRNFSLSFVFLKSYGLTIDSQNKKYCVKKLMKFILTIVHEK